MPVRTVPEKHPQNSDADVGFFMNQLEFQLQFIEKHPISIHRKRLLEKRSSKSDYHRFPPGLTAFHCVAFVAVRSSESVQMANPLQAAQAKINPREEALREIIKIFDKNGDINAKDDEGCAPLHYAVITNSEFTTKLLLESENCDGNVLDWQGRTPLMMACLKNADKVMKQLIGAKELPPNMLERKYAHGDTILHFLFKCERTMINAFLDALDSNAWMESLRKMLNVKNDLGITPLQICVEAGHVQELERLLNLLKLAVPFAFRPVDSARVALEQEISNFLQEEQNYLQEDKTKTIEQNSQILHVAAAIGNIEIFKLLREFGFPIKDKNGEMVQNQDGENLFHVAAKNNHRKIIEQLFGFDPKDGREFPPVGLVLN